eukprot:gnl/MRDRNA2_/MRDRNA2_127129_c0_seq1.p1 gnl/MRDRNA2_/MRDRNA2_127129_c0~~gnl/MRDRNA2_/MRDRNA2_127129_c0_seq1.p1  ORF type:complete len:416 (-),score=94.10 gnl/MRDRNA2_/MRDRNA2_127129_c0_seq1:448-1635(-)
MPVYKDPAFGEMHLPSEVPLDAGTNARMKKLFNRLDLNKDKGISLSELQRMLRAVDPNWKEVDIKELFDSCNANHDSMIDYHEFVDSLWPIVGDEHTEANMLKELQHPPFMLAEKTATLVRLANFLRAGDRRLVRVDLDVHTKSRQQGSLATLAFPVVADALGSVGSQDAPALWGKASECLHLLVMGCPANGDAFTKIPCHSAEYIQPGEGPARALAAIIMGAEEGDLETAAAEEAAEAVAALAVHASCRRLRAMRQEVPAALVILLTQGGTGRARMWAAAALAQLCDGTDDTARQARQVILDEPGALHFLVMTAGHGRRDVSKKTTWPSEATIDCRAPGHLLPWAAAACLAQLAKIFSKQLEAAGAFSALQKLLSSPDPLEHSNAGKALKALGQ